MTRHVIVDGSNLATEGRSMPSLTQLNEAVLAFMAEHPHDTVTVVVDATFGHRIEASEVDEFNEAVANNELVAPPAGAVGRGDAFVLSIANKVGGVVLSNDSFQEFHPEYPWLFDEGRLVGGKPVPHVGWVFVARTPVRGPVSRRATKEAKARASGRPVVRRSSKAASQPMPVPKAPPPRASFAAASESPKSQGSSAEVSESVAPKAAVSGGDWVNELLPFLDFAQDHPVGAVVEATVESYSSHGAYVIISEQLRGYVPLRLMGDPQPRSARSVLGLGDRVTLEVASYNPARRSVDLALRAVVPVSPGGAESTPSEPSGGSRATSKRSGRGSRRRGDEVTTAAETPSHQEPTESAESSVPSTTPAGEPPKKVAAKKVAAKSAVAERAPKKASASTVLEPAPAKKAPVKKAPAKKAPAKKVPSPKAAAKKAAAPAPAKKAPAKKVAAPAPAKKAPAKKVAAPAPAKKTPAKKVRAKQVPATKGSAKKSTATT